MKQKILKIALVLGILVAGFIGGVVSEQWTIHQASADLTTAEKQKLRAAMGDRTFADTLTVIFNKVDDITVEEFDVLDGVAAGTVSASKVVVVDASKDVTGGRNTTITGTLSAEQLTSTDDATVTDNLTAAAMIATDNAGTPGTGVSAVEYGDGYDHTTVLTLTSVAFTTGDNAALCDGALIYTFPAGEILVEGATVSVGSTLTTGTPTTDTPEICLGTVIGTGVVATCGTTATFEDIHGPMTQTDMAGTIDTLTQIGPTADNAGFVIADAAAHTVHLNMCDTWADVTDTAATVSGTVTIKWTFLHNPA